MDNNGWNQTHKITLDGDTNFGYSVDINENNTIIIGAPSNSDSNEQGKVYILKKNDIWYQESQYNDIYSFGVSVAINDNFSIIGSANIDDNLSNGKVYIKDLSLDIQTTFTRIDTNSIKYRIEYVLIHQIYQK